MTVFQKSFFESVPPEYGLVHLKEKLKAGSKSTFIDLAGVDAPVPDDSYVYARFLKESEIAIDDSGFAILT
jgi:hypothetical protein